MYERKTKIVSIKSNLVNGPTIRINDRVAFTWKALSATRRVTGTVVDIVKGRVVVDRGVLPDRYFYVHPEGMSDLTINR